VLAELDKSGCAKCANYDTANAETVSNTGIVTMLAEISLRADWLAASYAFRLQPANISL